MLCMDKVLEKNTTMLMPWLIAQVKATPKTTDTPETSTHHLKNENGWFTAFQ